IADGKPTEETAAFARAVLSALAAAGRLLSAAHRSVNGDILPDPPTEETAAFARAVLTDLRHEGAYLTICRGPRVARTVEIRPDLLVDLAADGRVIGVERLSGAVTAEDLAAVLMAVPFEEGRTDDR